MGDGTEDADREAFVKATAATAVAKHEGHLPSWLVEEMQSALEDVLGTHPVGATLMERVRPRKPPLQSGDVAKDAGDAVETARKRARR